ncbi:MAG: endonuclease V [Gammaproteobacteria bacterium]|nr:endonuclease V [Gammaproteobacteria bacterium]
MTTRRPAWPRTVSAARAVQEQLRGRVIAADKLGKVRFVAGIDVGFEDDGAITRAAVVVLTFPGLELHEQVVARRRTRFPYVPGYLSFREAPAVLAALAKLRTRPDLLLCDGQGLAHPRRFGLACHLGVLTGLPSIGVAKSLLIGRHDQLGEQRGAWAALKDVVIPRGPHPHSLSRREREASRGTPQVRSEIIGAALRTRAGVRPVYVSIGHRVGLATAIDYVLRCTPRYRLPETTRLAHQLASG